MAERLGLNATDHRCLRIAERAAARGEPVNAGTLADETGLTSGAITGVLDRLKKAGFIRRERDPADRRQIRVVLEDARRSELQALEAPLARAWRELAHGYTHDELAVLGRFVHDVGALLGDEIERLRGAAEVLAPGELAGLLDGASEGLLDIRGGISHVRVRAAAGPHLYRARFEGAAPKITAARGHVAIALTRSLLRMLKGARDDAEIVLSTEVPWSVRVRGGASDLALELREAAVASIQIDGGVHDVAMTLPAPHGTGTVKIRGGAHGLRILRPSGAPARVHVARGASGLTIDTLHLGAVGGGVRWQSPDYDAAADRWDITVQGGANELTIGAG